MPQRKKISRPAMPPLKIVAEECGDERFERTSEERRKHVEFMLSQLAISNIEKQFIINTAEKMVDLVCDEYVEAIRHNKLNPECISAAATVAMMIVYDDDLNRTDSIQPPI